MKQIDSPVSSLLIVERGEELLASLDKYARERGLHCAWLSGLGGAMKMTLGFYDIGTKQYQWREFDRPMEILTLQGNMAVVDGQPFWHVHGSFSDSDYRAVGGHVKELVVGLTVEIHVTPMATSITREYDETTGLKLICQSAK